MNLQRLTEQQIKNLKEGRYAFVGYTKYMTTIYMVDGKELEIVGDYMVTKRNKDYGKNRAYC